MRRGLLRALVVVASVAPSAPSTASAAAASDSGGGGATIEWYLRSDRSPGPPAFALGYGWNRCDPVRGDWDGDSTATIGVYCGGVWHLRNSLTAGPPDVTIEYGIAGYKPVVGDWDGDGDDTVGVVDGATWHLRHTNTPGQPDQSFEYGIPSYRFLVGDWDGDGDDTVGVYVDGTWHVRNQAGPGQPDASVPYGIATYQPVVGDWDGDDADDLGVVDGGTWHLRDSMTPGWPTTSVSYGTPAYAPLPGDSNGDGLDDLGVVHVPYQWSVVAASTVDLGASWRPGCPVPPADLRRLSLLHRLVDGRSRWGELVVHRDQATWLAAAMGRLYDAGFAIDQIVPVASYGGDDAASMAANNTSAFNCRLITGGVSFSEHSYGWAIDINPVQNPYVSGNQVLPPAGWAHLERSPYPGRITPGDVVVQAFEAIGWHWGGYWTSPIDYQHFSATNR